MSLSQITGMVSSSGSSNLSGLTVVVGETESQERVGLTVGGSTSSSQSLRLFSNRRLDGLAWRSSDESEFPDLRPVDANLTSLRRGSQCFPDKILCVVRFNRGRGRNALLGETSSRSEARLCGKLPGSVKYSAIWYEAAGWRGASRVALVSNSFRSHHRVRLVIGMFIEGK